jgi:hypothetical protein
MATNPNGGVLHRERMRFERDFTQLPNQWLRDRRLSRAARGLLAELMTHEAGYELSIAGLSAVGLEGRDAMRTMVTELETAGYLTRHRERRGGRLGGTIWKLQDPFDIPAPQPMIPGLERTATYAGKSNVGSANVGSAYVGSTASGNPTTIEDQVKKRNTHYPAQPQRTAARPVDNSRRAACGHQLVDDRHCEFGCKLEASA